VHWKEHGRYRFKGLPEPMEVFEVGEDKIAPLHAPVSGRTARKILPWYRRPFTLAAEAAMLVIGIGFGVWFLLQSPPTLAFAKRDWVVVGDLRNLTSDPRFDQSLDTALHISLEQSQYVNVLPELSVQQTLQRMERNPDKTKVTRAIGSEIALRDGARALILPTLAEVGGRVRVTAEVVDPNTQTTVYSVSADGTGAQSVLPSVDSVSEQLRGKLGEALAMVSKESQPLDKVATSNLDALRAYSLGARAYNDVDLKSTEAFCDQALRIDPHFALAHILLAKIFDAEDQPAKAMQELRAAQADRARLSARDALYVDAWIASYVSPRKGLEKWKLMASIYPDYFPGLGTYAYFLWGHANRFDQAIPLLKESASTKNPHRATSEYLLGAAYIEAGKYEDALHSFAQSIVDGAHYQNAYYASAYAAQRKFQDAVKVLKQGKLSGTGSFDISVASTRIAMALDQGNTQEADAILKSTQAQATSLGPRFVGRYEGMGLSVHALDGTSAKSQLAALADYIGNEHKALANADFGDRGELKFQIVLAAYLAARAGDVELAKEALADAGAASDADTPVLDNMLQVAQAEIARASGHAQRAISILKPLLDGSELYITHLALMDAEDDAHDQSGAMNQARWLSAHRGQAYMEENAQQMLTSFNVAAANIAARRVAHAAGK